MKKIQLLNRCILLLLLIAALVSVIPLNAVAAPYESYNYDSWDEEVVVPASYISKQVVDGTSLGIGGFKDPSDIYVDNSGCLYISDTGNNRIVKLENDLKTAAVIDKVMIGGEYKELEAPGGLFVDESGNIFVTQKELHRVLCIDASGNINKCYERPDSPLLEDDFEFLPTKVIKSTNGTVNILSEGYFYGALSYDKNGEFVGFYGCNKVDVTVQVLVDYAWKKFLSEEQKNKMTRYVPISYVSFDIDSDNFVYTCTQTTKNSKNELRKLNATGNDVISLYNKNLSSTSGNYGDLKSSYIMGKATDNMKCLFQYKIDFWSKKVQWCFKGDQYHILVKPLLFTILNSAVIMERYFFIIQI